MAVHPISPYRAAYRGPIPLLEIPQNRRPAFPDNPYWEPKANLAILIPLLHIDPDQRRRDCEGSEFAKDLIAAASAR